MSKLNETYSKYLHTAHNMKEMNTSEDWVKGMGFNLLDFLPEPRSLSYVLRLSPHTKEDRGVNS